MCLNRVFRRIAKDWKNCKARVGCVEERNASIWLRPASAGLVVFGLGVAAQEKRGQSGFSTVESRIGEVEKVKFGQSTELV